METQTTYCRGCRTELPEGAGTCTSCGRPHDPNEVPVAIETCEIVLWRGYVKSGFYAKLSSTAAAAQASEPPESPLFRSRERVPAPEGPALEAHEALVRQLLADGWEPAGRGPAWYALAFRRCIWSSMFDGFRPELYAAEIPAQVSPPAPAPAPPLPPPAPVPPVEAHVAEIEEEEAEETALLAEPRAPEPPPAAPARPRRWRRSAARAGLVLVGASSIGLMAGIAPTVLRTKPVQGSRSVESPLTVQRVHKAQPAARRSQAAATHVASVSHAVVPTRRPTHVSLSALRGDSWVDARAGSASGRSLYSGVLREGQSVRLVAARVWLSLGAAGNLDVLVNGRAPSPGLSGTLTVVAGRNGVQPG